MIESRTNSLDSELYATDIVGGDDQELRVLGNMLMAIRRNFWLISALACIAAACAFVAASLVEDRYTASSRVKLNTRITSDVEFTPGGPDLPINLASLESELEVMRSSDLIEASIFELELIERPADPEDEAARAEFEEELETLISDIIDRRTIEQVGTTSAVFEISVTDTNPLLASQLANAIGRQYLQRQTLEKIRTLERAQGWLTERTFQVQTQITDLVRQQETHVIDSPFSPEESATIRAQRQISERQLATKREQLSALEDRIARINVLTADGQFDAATALLSAPSARLMASLSQAETNPSDDWTQIITSEINAGLETLQRSVGDLQAAITVSERALVELRAKQELQAIHDGEARQIENEIAVTQAIYQDFVSELSRRTEQADFLDSDGRIIEFARQPRTPSEPNERLLSLAAFIGVMFAGLLAAVVFEFGNRKLRTTREFEETCGMEMRGVLPDLGREKDILARILAARADRSFPALYTFARKLRISVLASEKHSTALSVDHDRFRSVMGSDPATEHKHEKSDRRAKILAGGSTVPGEGQSTSLLALAQVLAEGGESVVLVDGDFWNSPYADQFANQAPGRTLHWGTKSALFESGTPGLKILPARPDTTVGGTRKDMSRYFGSKECDAVLSELASRFDRVIIDAPPLLDVVDTISLLGHADQVIFFSRWKSTKKTLVQNAIRLLDDVSIRPAFCVATRVKLREVARYGDTTLSHLNRAAYPTSH